MSPSTRQVAKEWNSTLMIHMPTQHFFNPYYGIVAMHSLAIGIARDMARAYGITLGSGSYLVKRPHLAFDRDLTAMFASRFATAEIKTMGEKALGGLIAASEQEKLKLMTRTIVICILPCRKQCIQWPMILRISQNFCPLTGTRIIR